MVDWVDRSLGKATSRLEVTENKPEEYNDPLEDIKDNEIAEMNLN
jgi:hypothetical protein